MNSSLSKIQLRTNRRVRTIWFSRRVFRSPILKLLIISAALLWMRVYVSFRNVWSNAQSVGGLPADAEFFFNAFMHTEFLIKMLTVVFLAVITWLVQDTLKLIRRKEEVTEVTYA